MPKTNYFLTRCGFRLSYDAEDLLWFDEDMTFDADADGHPIDDNGERLQGIYCTRGAAS